MTGLQRNLLLVNRKTKCKSKLVFRLTWGQTGGGGGGMEEQFCTAENEQIIPSSHSEGMTEEDRGSVAG